MIPKIIHYVWVGNEPKSELVLKCIESWKKYCPDYKIIEWNDNILSKIDNAYVKEAYEHKKWAFVSDYLRLYALYHHGGFYFDTDLELTQNIDNFIKHDFTMGLEIYNGNIAYQTALIGAEKNSEVVANLLNTYNNIHFAHNGKLDLTPNPTRFKQCFEFYYNSLKQKISDKQIVLEDNFVIYPSHYFCKPQAGKVNYAIHHFDGSWLDPYIRKNKFCWGKFALVCIKANSTAFKKSLEPDFQSLLQKDERIILQIRKSKRKMLYLIKRK